MSGYGPTLPRHTLNVAGSVFLPKGFELTMNMAYIMRLPVNPTVPNLFLPGTVPTSTSGADPIPDLAFNCLAITCGKAQFASAVANFKSTIGDTKNAPGVVIPQLALPNNYELDEPTMTQDLSLQKTFTFKERFKFLLIRQVFNALNISNLTGDAFTLDLKAANPAAQTFTFGQPTCRALQTFGSAGPRAFQLAGRFIF